MAVSSLSPQPPAAGQGGSCQLPSGQHPAPSMPATLSFCFASTSHTPSYPPTGSSERLPAQTDPCRAWQARGVQQAQCDANAHGSCFFTAVSSPMPAEVLFSLTIMAAKGYMDCKHSINTTITPRLTQDIDIRLLENTSCGGSATGPLATGPGDRCELLRRWRRACAASDPAAACCYTVRPAGCRLGLGGGQGHVVREEGGVVVVLSTWRGGPGEAGWVAEESAGRAALLLPPGQRHPAHAPRG